MDVCQYTGEDEAQWDELVGRALNGTFLHSRRFLGYHGNRFRDVSACLHDSGRLVAVFPAAVDPGDPACVTSHPGATYGGLVHDGALRGAAMIEALAAVREHYRSLGFSRLRYKAIPRNYHRIPSDDDLYALFRLNAARYRCDLSAVIDLHDRPVVSRRRRRCLRSALANGVRVRENPELLCTFWPLLEDTLERRHGARPTHSLDEITLLRSLFPEQIRVAAALAGEELLGGVVLFVMPTTVHIQYSCASRRGFSLHALDAVFDHCITAAAGTGARWFSMGISNEDGGRVLNENLYRFKVEFGAGSTTHEFYQLELQ